MENLSEPNPRDLHDESEEEPDFKHLPDLEAMGLERVGKGFGTSLNKKRREKEKDADSQSASQALVATKREPGENAKDFTRDIYDLVNDDSRK